MSGSRHATIKTIAKEAKVTANTVSLALHGSPRVKEQTKKKILEIAEKQGYVPNNTAEALRSGHSKLIALIFGDIANPLFAIKTRKIEEILRKHGYQVMITDTNENLSDEVDAVRSAIGRKVDGVVLCPCQKGRDALDMLKKYKIPCVLVGRSMGDGREDTVMWDNYNGGKMATQYLISLGCKNILCLLGPKEMSTSLERQRGYLDALREAGIEAKDDLQISVMPDEFNSVLKQKKKEYDGIFAFSDPYAWKAYFALDEKVPIIGFDDVKTSLSIPIDFPSVAADIDQEAEYVVDLLLKRLEDFERPVSELLIPVKITF